ncbi:uncharacterized protein [Hemitrygon akajei]|uniref:uncharacterized protein isoform X2 n=1 Tax=Hemitrygon akajei TaxID=2704970 RepID=UPI003BF94381
MLFCSHFLSFFLLPSLGAAVRSKEVIGTIGSSVFLDPELQGDLSKSEILWTFTGSNKSPVTILDYVPDKPVEEPNEQFRSRLQFNASTGCLLVDRIKPEDQGFYSFVVDKRRTTTIELLLFLFQSLINCNILSVVATFVALISWIAIKGAAFISVVALCTVSVLFLAIITPIVILKFSCSFNGRFQGKKGSQPFTDFSGFIIFPISITILKEEIQQNYQSCPTSNLAWSIPIALLVSCVIIMSVFLATYRCKYQTKMKTLK